MEIETVKAHCAAKKGAWQEYPFGPDALVFKVMGKMFALIPENVSPRINLKCDPLLAEALRQTYSAVQPGYHMNKRHWNTVLIDGSIPEDELFEMIDQSYDLVVAGLKKADRDVLEQMN